MKLERRYIRELVKVLATDLEDAVVLKHADQVTSGIPDLSVTWSGLTFWIEVKRGSTIEARGIQVLTATRLARQGHCFFVLYGEDSTSIFTPKGVDSRQTSSESRYTGRSSWTRRSPEPALGPASGSALLTVAVYPGTDHHAIARYIRSLHDHHKA